MFDEADKDAGRNWISAFEALKLVKELVGENEASAAESLARWAGAGLVRTRSRFSRFWPEDDPDDIIDQRNTIVMPSFWRGYGELDEAVDGSWKAGDFKIRSYENRDMRVTQVLGVQFDADEISAAAPPRLAPPTISTVAIADETTPSRTPLSDDLLRRWFELFQYAYPNGGIEQAWASAKGMFPDKSVTRERVRALLPDRPKGRPRKNNETS